MDILLAELYAGGADGREIIQALLRLTIAVVCGGAIGYQRERVGKAAGLRTHIITAAGSALLVIAGIHAEMGEDALSRIVQGLVTGIGFLGAGAIIQSRGRVGGLATAASIWVAGAVGMACGLGYYSHAFLLAVVTAIILALSRFIEGRGGEHEPGGHQAKRDAGDEEEERG